MRGSIVETKLSSADYVKSHLPKWAPWKHISGNIVEENITSADHVRSHLPELITWKDMTWCIVGLRRIQRGHPIKHQTPVIQVLNYVNMHVTNNSIFHVTPPNIKPILISSPQTKNNLTEMTRWGPWNVPSGPVRSAWRRGNLQDI